MKINEIMRKCAICFKKKQGGNGSFFKVPIQESERLMWSRSCRTQLKANDYICYDHFSREDIVCSGKSPRLLAKAIPFAPSSYDCVPNCMAAVEYSSSSPLIEPAIAQVKDCETQTDFVVLESLREDEISKLQKELKKLKTENRQLTYKLNETNAVMTNIKNIFTEGQIRKLALPNQNVKWSYKDISNAVCLHAAGPRAYNHLYQKGFPLLHVTTLQRWCRRSDISIS